MTMEHVDFAQGDFLAQHGHDGEDGICLELCRRWVRYVLTHPHPNLARSIRYAAKNSKADRIVTDFHNNGRHGRIEGLNRKSVHSRHGLFGIGGFVGLKTRLDVIDRVLDHQGAYIFTFTGPSGGHAFAFDTRRATRVLFFDPNMGGYKFKHETRNVIRTWYADFWDNSLGGGINYKGHFRQGFRKLYRFTLPPG